MKQIKFYDRSHYLVHAIVFKFSLPVDSKKAGIFHFVEHLVLNKLSSLLSKEIAAGMAINARTSIDSLSIIFKGNSLVLNHATERFMDILQNRKLEITLDIFEKEKLIIKQEASNDVKIVQKLILKSIIENTNNPTIKKLDVIGNEQSIESITLDEVKMIIQNLFIECNCSMFVIGLESLLKDIAMKEKIVTNHQYYDVKNSFKLTKSKIKINADTDLNYAFYIDSSKFVDSQKYIANIVLLTIKNLLEKINKRSLTNYYIFDHGFLLWSFDNITDKLITIDEKEFMSELISNIDNYSKEFLFNQNKIDFLINESIIYGYSLNEIISNLSIDYALELFTKIKNL